MVDSAGTDASQRERAAGEGAHASACEGAVGTDADELAAGTCAVHQHRLLRVEKRGRLRLAYEERYLQGRVAAQVRSRFQARRVPLHRGAARVAWLDRRGRRLWERCVSAYPHAQRRRGVESGRVEEQSQHCPAGCARHIGQVAAPPLAVGPLAAPVPSGLVLEEPPAPPARGLHHPTLAGARVHALEPLLPARPPVVRQRLPLPALAPQHSRALSARRRTARGAGRATLALEAIPVVVSWTRLHRLALLPGHRARLPSLSRRRCTQDALQELAQLLLRACHVKQHPILPHPGAVLASPRVVRLAAQPRHRHRPRAVSPFPLALVARIARPHPHDAVRREAAGDEERGGDAGVIEGMQRREREAPALALFLCACPRRGGG
mmetsp:Transcript_48249/g.113898  ORF Transcript_48249/g.113898 Transcript_48249/m.113898 type:complete len:380 (-) Transcript_48249:4412-5551(-)